MKHLFAQRNPPKSGGKWRGKIIIGRVAILVLASAKPYSSSEKFSITLHNSFKKKLFIPFKVQSNEKLKLTNHSHQQ